MLSIKHIAYHPAQLLKATQLHVANHQYSTSRVANQSETKSHISYCVTAKSHLRVASGVLATPVLIVLKQCV